MVLSAWLEECGRLRVRITQADDLATDHGTTTYTTDTADVLRIVEDWLDALVTAR